MNRRRSLEEADFHDASDQNDSPHLPGGGGSPRRLSRLEQQQQQQDHVDAVMHDANANDGGNKDSGMEAENHDEYSEYSNDSSDDDDDDYTHDDDSQLDEDMHDFYDSYEEEEDFEDANDNDNDNYDDNDNNTTAFGGDGGVTFLNQLQRILLSGGATSQQDLDRIRQTIQSQLAQGFFGMARAQMATADELRRVLRQLRPDTGIETLFAVLSQAWELIVLTGEQLGQSEFDSVVDLRPLIPHLLRVLAWQSDCQLLGLEFLMTAIKCTRGVLQYSPASMRRLVDGGMVPLLTQQLQQVEYIDLAEDLIFILQLLSRPGAYPRACLHANGLNAVLGFVDFHALPVQVSAFTAAAQMCLALTPDTYQNYLLHSDLLALMKQTVATRLDEPKLIHWSLCALLNACVAGVPCSVLFGSPSDFLQDSVYPLTSKLPADVINALLTVAPAMPVPLPIPLAQLFDGCIKDDGRIDEAQLDACLSLAVCLVGGNSAKQSEQSQPSLALYLLRRFCPRVSIPEPSQVLIEPSLVASIVLGFCSRPGSSPSRAQWRSCAAVVLLAFELAQGSIEMSLLAFGLLSRFVSSSEDIFLRLVALRWCSLVLEKSSSPSPQQQQQTCKAVARRQGILEELKQIPLSECQALLGQDAPAALRELISETTLTRLIASLEDKSDASESSHATAAADDLLASLLQSDFTEFELLGDPETCVAARLLQDASLLQRVLADEPSRAATVQALHRALLRYAHPFFPSNKAPEFSRRGSLTDALSPLVRQMKLKVRFGGAEHFIITSPMVTVGMIGSKLTGNPTNTSLIEAVRRVRSPPASDVDWNGLTALWSPVMTLVIEEAAANGGSSSDDVEIIEKELEVPGRIQLALELLQRLKSGHSKELSALLQAALDAPLVVALNALPRPFMWTAQHFPFMFPFALRVQLLRECFFDRFRALATLKARISASTANNAPIGQGLGDNDDIDDDEAGFDGQFSIGHFTHVPKVKFVVDREALSVTLERLFAPDSPHLSDSRVFEFAYTGELGTGHGPTLEFYALASDFYASKLIQGTHGLCPDYTRPIDETALIFFQIGALCGRALLDERVIDISLDEDLIYSDQSVFDASSVGSVGASSVDVVDAGFTASTDPTDFTSSTDSTALGLSLLLPRIDQQLFHTVNRKWTNEMSTAALEFPDWSQLAGQALTTAADWTVYRSLLADRIATAVKTARESFRAGFDASNAADFDADLGRLFSPADLTALFSSSLGTGQWPVALILGSLVPDHGYTLASPQLHWLAEIISEAAGPAERKEILRFLTGAPGLPIGGWPAIRLTIVSKSDDSASNSNSPTLSSTGSLVGHANDSYLPSVMTCANYLKLPRYSSKEIMRERLWYAIREGNNSFYLS